MRRLVAVAAFCAAACAAPSPEGSTAFEAPSAVPIAPGAVARGNADFGVALYKGLAAEPGNVFISPISIAGAFGPVSAGARGETLAEIARALRLPAGGGSALHPALGGLLRDLEGEREGASLSIANALWVQQRFPLKPVFESIARGDYDARVETLDFERNQEAAARINGWVKDETRGRIPILVSAGSLGRDTALVVTNAVYFLGDWMTPFSAGATNDQPFYLQGAGIRQVPLMYRKDAFRYFETGTFQAIDLPYKDLPYKDERLAMSVFLPKRRGGLPGFEAELGEAELRGWLARLDASPPREVRLHLPKLKIEQDYDLIPPLRALGINLAFTRDKADLRGIAEANLFINQVIHKTFLRVDEKGTEAAAATAIEIEVTGAPAVPPPVFRADHPFFFVIREKPSGAILFLGRISAPERP